MNVNSDGSVSDWDHTHMDRELENDNGFSRLGSTVMNGTADDVVALIRSKEPYDPLLGKT